MVDPVHVMKSRARILRREAKAGDPKALRRVRALPEFRTTDPAELPSLVKLRHCLSVLALEFGFSNWIHALRVLTGEERDDFGTLLYPAGASAYWNIWCASYEEAKRIHEEHRGYLLAYRNQFLITDRHFVEFLGLDPDDLDWERIGRDWVRPGDPEARRRLYGRLIDADGVESQA